MKGLRLARECWRERAPLLEKLLPDVIGHAAFGLAGEGSERFGLDDEISRDHDFGAAFCVWLPDDLLETSRPRIRQALLSLPDSYMGYDSRMSGNPRAGAIGIRAFYQGLTGLGHPPANWREWLSIPEIQLAAATNGEVFEDRSGAFSAWRERLLAYYPEDVRLKKMAARVMAMAQAGQYNLPRSLKRGDSIAAMLAAARFSEAAISFVFLLNKKYMPYYKLAPRLGRDLDMLGEELYETLASLAANPLMRAVDDIENFCALCARRLRQLDLSSETDLWLWAHGPSIAMRIQNPEIRARNLLAD